MRQKLTSYEKLGDGDFNSKMSMLLNLGSRLIISLIILGRVSIGFIMDLSEAWLSFSAEWT